MRLPPLLLKVDVIQKCFDPLRESLGLYLARKAPFAAHLKFQNSSVQPHH